MSVPTMAALALVLAVVDWIAVARGKRSVEFVAKPAVLLAIIATAALIPSNVPEVKALVIAGLVLGLVGDVLLMLEGKFVAGALAFLLGHLCYIAGFLQIPHDSEGLAFAAVLVVAALVAFGRCIVAGAYRRRHVLGYVVGMYMVSLGIMAVLGIGSQSVLLQIGVLLFAISDTLLGWGRFVGSAPGGRVLVHMTYHVGQLLIALSLTQIMASLAVA